MPTPNPRRTMDQSKIWDHFQTAGVESFAQNEARLGFIATRIPPRTRVLNVGVGNGFLERRLLDKGCDAWALDPSERSIEHLRTAYGLGERAKVGYVQNMPFKDATFDVVVMSEVLEHLAPNEFRMALSEVDRVLRGRGRFVGTVPADEELSQSTVVCPKCGALFHRWGHTRSFSREALFNELSHRFSDVRVRRYFFANPAHLNWKGRIACLAKQLLCVVGVPGANENLYFEALTS